MKIENNFIIFSSGNSIYLEYNNIIGLDADECLLVYEGYDDFLIMEGLTKISKEDYVELADYMIECWKKFKENKIKE